MRISNVRVSYSTSLIKESVSDAIELTERVKKRNRRVAVCMIAAVIATMVVAAIMMGSFEGAFVVGVVVAVFLWGRLLCICHGCGFVTNNRGCCALQRDKELVH